MIFGPLVSRSLFGRLQGFIQGPLLYVLYTADLSHVLSSLKVVPHQYADNTRANINGQAAAKKLVETSEALAHGCHPIASDLILENSTGNRLAALEDRPI